MIKTKGGYAIADLTFLTPADFQSLMTGGTISISKKQYDQISGAFDSGKPTYIMYFTPTAHHRLEYVFIDQVDTAETIGMFTYLANVYMDLAGSGSLTLIEFACNQTLTDNVLEYTLTATVHS